MNNDQIFLVQYWVGFPCSEYGGLQAVIARDEDEAVAFLVEQANEEWHDYYREQYPDFEVRIRNAVGEAKRFPVNSGSCDRGIVAEFLT
jgi:hypothetical protein